MAAKYRNKANHKTKCQRVKVKPKKKGERKAKKKNQSTNFIRIDLSAGGKRVKGKKWLKMATSVIYDMQLIRQMENIRENGSGQANNLGK